MSNRELEDFTNASLARWERPEDPDEQQDDDQQDDEQPAEGADAEEAGTAAATDADQAAFNRWVESLTPGEAQRAATDERWRDYNFGLYLTREDAKATFEAANHPVDTGAAPDEPMPQTGGEVVDWVYAHAAEIRRDHGVGPGEYLAAIAGAGQAEWRRFATEAGIGLDAKPSFGQLPRGAQAAVVRADVANWTAEDFRK